MILNKKDIINTISNLNILELNDLIKSFEKKFGISVNDLNNNINSNNNINLNKNLQKNNQTKFSVIITEITGSKISAIKIVREVTGLGLKESKNLVDNIPKSIKDNLNKLEAEDLIKKLNSIGVKSILK